MGVVRRFSENIPDDAFCKCTLSLILLLYYLHPQTWRYFRSVSYIHGYILWQHPVSLAEGATIY